MQQKIKGAVEEQRRGGSVGIHGPGIQVMDGNVGLQRSPNLVTTESMRSAGEHLTFGMSQISGAAGGWVSSRCFHKGGVSVTIVCSNRVWFRSPPSSDASCL